MYFLIFFLGTLGFHVSLYRAFISVAADCVNIVPFCPKLPTPKLLLDFWMKIENLFRCDAFDRLDYPCWTHHRYTLYQKMNMVQVSPNLNKCHLIPLRDLQANFLQTHIHSCTKNYSSVFCWTDKMI